MGSMCYKMAQRSNILSVPGHMCSSRWEVLSIKTIKRWELQEFKTQTIMIFGF